jgi:hypothetical protein
VLCALKIIIEVFNDSRDIFFATGSQKYSYSSWKHFSSAASIVLPFDCNLPTYCGLLNGQI